MTHNADPPIAALADFGRLIGISGLSFDASGYCCLLIDGITLNLEFDPPTGQLLFYAHMGLVPEDCDAGFHAMLLEGDYFCRGTNGATLGTDAATRAIVLYDARPAADFDGAALEAHIGRFIDIAEHWRERIATYGAREATPPADFNVSARLNATRI